MGRNAEQIRQEIEQTRGQLGQTLEAIGDRVSPKHVVEELAEKVSPRRLMRRQTDKVKDGLSSAGDSVRSRASSATSSVPRLSVPRIDTSGVTDGVRDSAQGLTGRVRSVSTTAADQVRTAPEDRPFVAGLVAFGAGLAAALLLPPTAKEQEAAAKVGDSIEPLKARAVERGKAVVGEVQSGAQQRVERVKQTATGAADRVRSQTKGATAEVKGEAAGAAEEVKGRAKRTAVTTKTAATSTAKRTAASVKQKASAV